MYKIRENNTKGQYSMNTIIEVIVKNFYIIYHWIKVLSSVDTVWSTSIWRLTILVNSGVTYLQPDKKTLLVLYSLHKQNTKYKFCLLPSCN